MRPARPSVTSRDRATVCEASISPVCITGASGFLGGHLTARLIAAGRDVRALVAPGVDARPLAERGVTVVRGDLSDRDAVLRAVEECEVVFHLAGIVPTPGIAGRVYFEVNVGGTENVLAAALAAGVRHLVHCSSAGVYGDRPPERVSEDDPAAPANLYQRSKLAAEERVRRCAREQGLSAVIARPAAAYGPGDRRSLKLYRDVARGRVLVVGDGRVRSQLVYVDDLVAGLELCGERRGAGGECFLLAGDDAPNVCELIAVIAAECRVDPRVLHLPRTPFALAAALHRGLRRGGARPGRLDRLAFFLGDRVYDCSRARRELGYQPRVPLREGVSRTVAWYRSEGLL